MPRSTVASGVAVTAAEPLAPRSGRGRSNPSARTQGDDQGSKHSHDENNRNRRLMHP